jgi:hypothetical protein
MSRYQAAIYNWVKATGTLRLSPGNALAGKTRHPFVPLNNKVMELRKVRGAMTMSLGCPDSSPESPNDIAPAPCFCGAFLLDLGVVFCSAAHADGHAAM